MKQKLNRFGFTILEMIVVLSIIGLLLPAVFSLFFSSLRAQSKVLILQQVKSNGDNALNVIESVTRQSGVSLHSDNPPSITNQVCVNNGTTYSAGNIYVLDKNGDWFSFYLNNSAIASESGTIGVQDLTSDKVEITNFTLTCSRSSQTSPPLISISFTVSQTGSPGRQEQEATLNYQTKVKLRSY